MSIRSHNCADSFNPHLETLRRIVFVLQRFVWTLCPPLKWMVSVSVEIWIRSDTEGDTHGHTHARTHTRSVRDLTHTVASQWATRHTVLTVGCMEIAWMSAYWPQPSLTMWSARANQNARFSKCSNGPEICWACSGDYPEDNHVVCEGQWDCVIPLLLATT